jgi:hypothetical protein
MYMYVDIRVHIHVCARARLVRYLVILLLPLVWANYSLASVRVALGHELKLLTYGAQVEHDIHLAAGTGAASSAPHTHILHNAGIPAISMPRATCWAPALPVRLTLATAGVAWRTLPLVADQGLHAPLLHTVGAHRACLIV